MTCAEQCERFGLELSLSDRRATRAFRPDVVPLPQPWRKLSVVSASRAGWVNGCCERSIARNCRACIRCDRGLRFENKGSYFPAFRNARGSRYGNERSWGLARVPPSGVLGSSALTTGRRCSVRMWAKGFAVACIGYVISSIGLPWSMSSRLRPGISSLRESSPSCFRIVA